MEKQTYCRACGKNKGHSFDKCTNYSRMRRLIKSQDDEMQGYISRVESLSKLLTQSTELAKQAQQLRRVVNVLSWCFESKMDEQR